MGALNVIVTHPSGSAASGIKVGGKVNGFLGGMLENVRTDARGHACLEWSGSGSLETIYVNGKEKNGRYCSGVTYAFSV